MPDEIRCLGEDRQLLFLRGLRPILADKEPYYRAWRYRGRWDRWNA
jgi:type IV secretory pathway TraG/TraD family ATPase VirD4